MKNKIKNSPIFGPIATAMGQNYRDVKSWVHWKRFFYKNRKFFQKNKSIKNSESGKRCFVVATGPSIKSMDLKNLANEYCISVSNFFVHPDFQKIKPKYHLFVASHTPVTDDQMTSWLKDADEKFPKNQKVFVSAVDKYLVDKHKIFTDDDIYYYLFGNANMTAGQTIDFTKRIPDSQTSAQIAMYLAIYTGVKEIYLLGVDHDWILHVGESRHFYEESKSALMKGGYKEWSQPLEVSFQAYINLWRVYKGIKEYADAHGVKIYNATPGSLLDVFPRVKLESVLQ